MEMKIPSEAETTQVAPSPDTPLEDTVKLAQKGLNIYSGESKAIGRQVITEKKNVT